MFKLMRIVGGAVVMGMGAKAGSELYDALRERARRARGEEAARDVTVDGQASRPDPDETLDDAEARLEAERARIERELERLRRKRNRRG